MRLAERVYLNAITQTLELSKARASMFEPETWSKVCRGLKVLAEEAERVWKDNERSASNVGVNNRGRDTDGSSSFCAPTSVD